MGKEKERGRKKQRGSGEKTRNGGGDRFCFVFCSTNKICSLRGVSFQPISAITRLAPNKHLQLKAVIAFSRLQN